MVMVVRLFDPWIGGMERQALSLAQALVRAGHHVRILTGRWFRGTPHRQSYDGVEVIRHGALYDGFGIRGARRIAALVYMVTLAFALVRHRRSYDVIHVHGLSYHAYVAVRCARVLNKPVIVKLANSGKASDISKMKSGQHLFLSRYLLPTALMADRLVALNAIIRGELEAEAVSPDKIAEIPNGVCIPDRWVSSEHPGPERVVSFVGRLHEQKAVDVLIRGFAGLPDPLKHKTVLRIVGDGPVRPALEALATDLCDQASIEFTGQVDDVDPDLEETDVLVLPSVAEGMSNTLLEAMARAIPVIASNIPSNAVLIEHGETGWLFEPNDWTALTDLLASILEDAELLRGVGERGRRLVAEQYAIDRIGDRYADLYRQLSETFA